MVEVPAPKFSDVLWETKRFAGPQLLSVKSACTTRTWEQEIVVFAFLFLRECRTLYVPHMKVTFTSPSF